MTGSRSTYGATLVAHWFDSDLPSARTRSMELWNVPGDGLVLYYRERERPSDVWPVPERVRAVPNLQRAHAIARLRGLDPYLVRS